MNALDHAQQNAALAVQRILWAQYIETTTAKRDPIPMVADRVVATVMRVLSEAMRQEKAQRVT